MNANLFVNFLPLLLTFSDFLFTQLCFYGCLIIGKQRCDENSNSGGSFDSFLCPFASRFMTTKLVFTIFKTSVICWWKVNNRESLFVNGMGSNKPQDRD